MKSKRLLATIPNSTKKSLMTFADQHGIDHSLVVQEAITKMSEQYPTENDISYIRGETGQLQVTLSDTAYRLLELWSEQTTLTKSKLITYSLQKFIMENGGY